MPEYEFITESGQGEVHFLPFDDAPSIGSWVCLNGKQLRRVASMPAGISVSIDPHFVAESINQYHPAIEAAGLSRRKDGQPRFGGNRDVKKFCDESRKLADKDNCVTGYGYD